MTPPPTGAPAPAMTPALLAVIALNAFPILGVLAFGWNAGLLILFYWLENVVIGFGVLVRMALAGLARGEGRSLLFFGPFFTVHYGLFCLVHGVFVVSLFGGGFGADGDPFLGLAAGVGELLSGPEGAAAGAVLAAGQGLDIARRFWPQRAERSPMALMMEPYGRIVVLHITLIAGGFVLAALGGPIWGLVLLTLVKTGFDVWSARATPGGGWAGLVERFTPAANPTPRKSGPPSGPPPQ